MSRKLKYLPLYSKKSKKSPYFQTKYGGQGTYILLRFKDETRTRKSEHWDN